MILLDTTVLVYAVGADHRLRDPARALIGLLVEGEIRASTTVEVVQEFAHVRARRRPRAEAAARAREFALGLSPLTRPDEDDLYVGFDLASRSEDLGFFDAVLASTARRRGWPLVSADRSFGGVDGLRYLDLSSPGFLDEVRATS